MTVNINAANISSVQLAVAQTPSAPSAGFVRLHHNANSRLAMRPATGNVVEFLGNTSGSGAGITFPATQSPSSDANTLDDYEEGTWTMGITFGGAAAGVTYSANTGTYTKVGRKVTVAGFLILSNKGSSTGGARITGLPFTVLDADSGYTGAAIGYLENVTFADVPLCHTVRNATTLELREVTNAGVLTNLSSLDFANNSGIIIGLTYFV